MQIVFISFLVNSTRRGYSSSSSQKSVQLNQPEWLITHEQIENIVDLSSAIESSLYLAFMDRIDILYFKRFASISILILILKKINIWIRCIYTII